MTQHAELHFELHHGDCMDVIKTLADNSLDACVTDPPYGLQFMGKEWDKLWRNGSDADQAYLARTDGELTSRQRKLPDYSATHPVQMQQWHETWARGVFRVLKPGAHVVAFSGTRTYHRMACAIEDAGFQIRDQLAWVYGSGFPKSHNVPMAIEKSKGAPSRGKAFNIKGRGDRVGEFDANWREFLPPYKATTKDGEQWQGWGSALKPAWEPICLARKPLIGTVAANVLAHGTGAINVDGCRVETAAESFVDNRTVRSNSVFGKLNAADYDGSKGRWPANIVHDGSKEVMAAFPDAPGQQRGVGPANGEKASVNVYGDYGAREQFDPRGDSGSAARFFYTAKADAEDRFGSKHPTVKPVDLMQWLIRLVTPKGGIVIDPFAGTGTTGEAAFLEGVKSILIERDDKYLKDIRARMEHVRSGPIARQVARVKNSGDAESVEKLPLFRGPNDVA
jgi:DNA modification methylase